MTPRGQATTELALGSLLFVAVLLFGIHFGEVPVLMLKMKEASNYAITHATGERTHLFSRSAILSGNTYAPFSPAAISADVKARYRDFDGMSDRTSGSSFTAAVTEASAFKVKCAQDPSLSFGLQRPKNTIRTSANGKAFYDSTFNFLDGRYQDRGGISCDVSATVTALRIPSSFADNGSSGFFKEPLVAQGKFPICGAGRPKKGACKGQLTVLSGDWAFDGPLTGANSRLNGDVESFEHGLVDNDGYLEFVRQLYTKNGDSQGNAGRKLLELGAGSFPGDPEYLDESKFNMSFKGVVGGAPVAVVPRVIVDAPKLRYQTSGADLRSDYVGWVEGVGQNTRVPTCFLGLAMPPKTNDCRN